VRRRSSRATRVGLAIASAWLSGCGSDVTGPPRPWAVQVTTPQNVAAGLTLPVVTALVVDRSGHAIPGPMVVTLDLAPNSQGATLSGTRTVAALDGVASFADLRISRAGRAFALVATAASATGRSNPFEVRLRLVSVSVGNGMACGLAPSGDAYCWGRNHTGGLGNGTSGSDTARPVLVAGDLTFAQVEAGAGSNTNGIFDGGACGLTAAGAAYCWGRNDYGQLGNGHGGTDSKVPVRVSGSIPFASVGMGMHHTCGLARSSEVYCWGNNDGGQLGTDSLGVGHDVPVRVAGGRTYTALWVGDWSTCARATAGDVYCWGGGAPTVQDGAPVSDAPTLLAGGVAFSQIHPGTFLHMCGVSATGEGYCWGQDYLAAGTLGTASPGHDEPAPALVTGAHHWISIGAGGSSSCGLRADSLAMCWGYDYNGEVGQGTPGRGATAPALVFGSLKFTQLDVGHGTSCAVAWWGDAFCWGLGVWGERGDGTFTAQAALPGRVVTP
jgi:alpha-tubulin suppressor-like RCC1 family protein